jgi:mRNA interferase RelE/StbE
MEIVYQKSALKSLTKLAVNVRLQIIEKIEQYAADPTSLAANVTRLQGREGYRLRVGNYRVIFDLDQKEDGQNTIRIMIVMDIGARGSVY